MCISMVGLFLGVSSVMGGRCTASLGYKKICQVAYMADSSGGSNRLALKLLEDTL